MKERLKNRGILGQLRRRRQAIWETGRYLLYSVGCGLLAALPVGSLPIPLAACLTAVSTGWDLAAAMVGSLAGYIWCWELTDSIYTMALTVILPGVAWAVRRGRHPAVPWLCPAATTVAAAALGLGFLWQLGFASPWTGRLFLSLLVVFAGSFTAQQALVFHRRWALYLLLAALLASLSRICLGLWFNPGICVALFLVAVTAWTPEGIVAAAVCGIVLELAAEPALPYTAFFCLTSGILYQLRHLTVFHRSLGLLLLSAAFAWLTAELQAQLVLLSAIAACLAALALPRLSLLADDSDDPVARLRRQLQRASDVLLRLHDTILLPQTTLQDPDAAEIFDTAADQVCRGCAQYSLCWEQEAARTYRELCTAAEPILTRYQAAATDFPTDFSERCQNFAQFVQAVNSQLDAILHRRQYRARQQENQELLRSQYLLMARYLQATADTATLPPADASRFEAEVAARAVGRSGRALSGDRGACFHGPGASFFVLLCDGMGTGQAAASQSSGAIEILSGLLRAGLDPASALQLLNSAYVLRDDGCFSTVDLLQIDLSTGDSLLLKWGAAPSYLKRDGKLRRLGEPTLPPGLTVGKAREIQRIKLTLQEDDLLVLTSDGADQNSTEAYLHESGAEALAELAAGIVAAADPGDDITAVALRLRPAAA